MKNTPVAGVPVLAWREGDVHPLRAIWAPKFYLEAADDFISGFAQYNSDTDTYYCPTGWYEFNDGASVYWQIEQPIVEWQAMPARLLP